jgi:hypothetical protein
MTLATVTETRSLNRLARVATLANGAIAAATDSQIAQMGNIETLTVFLNASAASTLTISTSPDGTNWYTAQAWSPTSAGTDSFSIPAAPFVKVQSSNPITLTAQVYGVGGW